MNVKKKLFFFNRVKIIVFFSIKINILYIEISDIYNVDIILFTVYISNLKYLRIYEFVKEIYFIQITPLLL